MSAADPGGTGPAPADRMMSMITGYWVTQIVRTVAELSIPDQLAEGPLTAAELAARIDADPDAVARLLRACASLGLTEADDRRAFHRTPLLDTLRAGTPHSLRTIALVHGSPGHWLPWGLLPDAVRSGTPQTGAALGHDIWAHFLAHPEEGERFATSMTELTAGLAEEVAALIDTDGVGVAVDVGARTARWCTRCCAATHDRAGWSWTCPPSRNPPAPKRARRDSPTGSPWSAVPSSTRCPGATSSCSRRSCTTGTTTPARPSCATAAPR